MPKFYNHTITVKLKYKVHAPTKAALKNAREQLAETPSYGLSSFGENGFTAQFIEPKKKRRKESQ